MTNTLTIYSKDRCGECTAVKRMLVKAGLIEDVYTEGREVQTGSSKYQIDIINITHNEDKRISLAAQGYQQMPVMQFDGKDATGLNTDFVRNFIDKALK